MVANLLSPRWGLSVCGFLTHGLRRGLCSVAASRLFLAWLRGYSVSRLRGYSWRVEAGIGGLVVWLPTLGLRRGLHSCAAIAAPHHHSNQGEQAVTSVTSIVVDLLRYEMPRVKNLRFVQVVAKIIGRFASQVFLSTSGDARVYICFLARVVIARAKIYFRKVPSRSSVKAFCSCS